MSANSATPPIPIIRINDEALTELSRSPSAVDRHRTPHPGLERSVSERSGFDRKPPTPRRARSPSPRRPRDDAASSSSSIQQRPVLLTMKPQLFHDRSSSTKSIQLLSVDVVVVYMSLANDQSRDLSPFQHSAKRQPTRNNTFRTESVRIGPPRRDRPTGRTETDANNAAVQPSAAASTRPAATMVEKPPQVSSEDPVNWLKDCNMLPGEIPGARIFGIGFEVPSKGSGSKIDLESAAEEMIGHIKKNRSGVSSTPIIFIGHGCGCFVIEQATVSRGDEFLEATAAMIFFGKPSDNRIKQKTQLPHILHEIKKLGPEVKTVADKFKNEMQLAAIPFISFTGIENLPDGQKTNFKAEMPRFDGVIKRSRDSPDLPFPLPLNFQNGVNFSSPNDAVFKLVADCILHFTDIWKFLDAARRNDNKVLLYFIVNGVDPNTKDKRQETALHKAVKHYNIEVVKTLQENGADLDIPDHIGMTALHRAAETDQREIVTFLLQKGATSSPKNNCRKTPVDLAEERGFYEVARLLRRPPLIEGPLHESDDEAPPASKLPKKGSQASREFFMTASELFLINGRENHFSVRQSVNDMVYGGQKLEDILSHHREDVGAAQLTCRWYHFPVNNVSGNLLQPSRLVCANVNGNRWFGLRY
jgi:hypothetical protein